MCEELAQTAAPAHRCAPLRLPEARARPRGSRGTRARARPGGSAPDQRGKRLRRLAGRRPSRKHKQGKGADHATHRRAAATGPAPRDRGSPLRPPRVAREEGSGRRPSTTRRSVPAGKRARWLSVRRGRSTASSAPCRIMAGTGWAAARPDGARRHRAWIARCIRGDGRQERIITTKPDSRTTVPTARSRHRRSASPATNSAHRSRQTPRPSPRGRPGRRSASKYSLYQNARSSAAGSGRGRAHCVRHAPAADGHQPANPLGRRRLDAMHAARPLQLEPATMAAERSARSMRSSRSWPIPPAAPSRRRRVEKRVGP